MTREEQENLPFVKGTRAEIMKLLLGKDLSALDLEEELGINESAVRRHLEVLEQKNYVEHYFKKASKGRPKKFFKLTESGRDVFPEKSRLLLGMLAESIEEKYGPEELGDLFLGLSRRLGKSFGIKEGEVSFESKLEKFVESMEKFSFFPDIEKENGNYEIKFKNCVFRAERGDIGKELCGLHDSFIREVFPEAEVEPKKNITAGDDTCVYEIRPKKVEKKD